MSGLAWPGFWKVVMPRNGEWGLCDGWMLLLLLLDGLGSFDGCAVRDGTCAATVWYVPAREKEGGRGCAPFPQVFI